LDLAQEDDLVVPLPHGHVVVAHPRQSAGGGGPIGCADVGRGPVSRRRQFRQLVVVGGEEGLGPDLVVQVLNDAPRQAQSVERTRSSADLVQDDQ